QLKFEDFRLATWDERILREVDGKKSLRTILDARHTRDLDVYQLFYVFHQTEMIEFTETEEERKEKVLYNKIWRFLDDLNNQDFFGMLGVRRSATPEQMKKSFDRRSDQYRVNSPTMNPIHSPRLNENLSKISSMLRHAHEVLRDPLQRSKYERDLF